jgi:hypothetical protein
VRDSAWFLAPALVLIAGSSVARGEMVEADVSWNPWWLRVVTQAPVTMPRSQRSVVAPSSPAAYLPSGVLPDPPPAPVAGRLRVFCRRHRSAGQLPSRRSHSRRHCGARNSARHFVPRRTENRLSQHCLVKPCPSLAWVATSLVIGGHPSPGSVDCPKLTFLARLIGSQFFGEFVCTATGE